MECQITVIHVLLTACCWGNTSAEDTILKLLVYAVTL